MSACPARGGPAIDVKRPNNGIQRPALRAAADAERYADHERSWRG